MTDIMMSEQHLLLWSIYDRALLQDRFYGETEQQIFLPAVLRFYHISERVDCGTVDAHLKMEVVAGRVTGSADFSYNVALIYRIAHFYK